MFWNIKWDQLCSITPSNINHWLVETHRSQSTGMFHSDLHDLPHHGWNSGWYVSVPLPFRILLFSFPNYLVLGLSLFLVFFLFYVDDAIRRQTKSQPIGAGPFVEETELHQHDVNCASLCCQYKWSWLLVFERESRAKLCTVGRINY